MYRLNTMDFSDRRQTTPSLTPMTRPKSVHNFRISPVETRLKTQYDVHSNWLADPGSEMQGLPLTV